MTSKLVSAGSRRIATRAGTLAVAAALLALAVWMGWPQSWGPPTAQVSAADTPLRPAGQDPCDLIVGPAKEYCERGTNSAKSSSICADGAAHGGSGAAWMLIPPAAGLTALLVWRRRAAGQGRR